jgi:hypothetical protein
MDKTVIRVLSIEDNPGDARLIQVLLSGAHSLGWDMPRFELEHVSRLSKGLARLEETAVVAGDPERAACHPERAAGDPEHAAGQPEGAAGHPEGAAGDPELVACHPERAAGDPEQIGRASCRERV